MKTLYLPPKKSWAHRLLGSLLIGCCSLVALPCAGQNSDPFRSASAPAADPFRSIPAGEASKKAPHPPATPRRSEAAPSATATAPDVELNTWQTIATSANAAD